MKIRDILNLPDGTFIEEPIHATIRSIYAPEAGYKGKQIQNAIIGDETGEIRIRFNDPAIFQRTDGAGKSITITPGRASGGDRSGQPCGISFKTGVSKGTGNTWYSLNLTAKASVEVSGNGSSPARSNKPANERVNSPSRPQIPFDAYVKDFHATVEHVAEILESEDLAYCAQVAVNAIISHRNQYELNTVKEGDLWEAWTHPKMGKTFAELYEAKPDKVIEKIILTDVMPHDMLLKACEACNVPLKDVILAAAEQLNVSPESIISYMEQNGSKDMESVIKAFNDPQGVKAFEPKEETDNETTEDDGWD